MGRQAGLLGGGLTSSPSPSGERTRPDCLPPPRNLVYGEGHGISLPPPCVRRGAAPPADPRGPARARPDRADRRQGGFGRPPARPGRRRRSEEHTSELQSLMRISYAVFCLQKTNK